MNDATDAGLAGREWEPSWSAAEFDAKVEDGPGVEPAVEEAAPAASGRPTDRGTPTTLVLLRHGETPLTPQKRFSGSGGSAGGGGARCAAGAACRGTLLVVSHVGPLRTLVRMALGAPAESLFRMELAAASLSEVAYYADGNASVRLLNDTGHLR